MHSYLQTSELDALQEKVSFAAKVQVFLVVDAEIWVILSANAGIGVGKGGPGQ